MFVFIYQDEGCRELVARLCRSGPGRVAQRRATTALPAIAVPAIWLGFGVSTLIMLAGMLDIPSSYYEAAQLDGAGFFQRTRYITIPLLQNVLLFLLVTGFTLAIQHVRAAAVMTERRPGRRDEHAEPVHLQQLPRP